MAVGKFGRGRRIIASAECFPESVAIRIREIADAFPDAEHETAGGLALALDEPIDTKKDGAR